MKHLSSDMFIKLAAELRLVDRWYFFRASSWSFLWWLPQYLLYNRFVSALFLPPYPQPNHQGVQRHCDWEGHFPICSLLAFSYLVSYLPPQLDRKLWQKDSNCNLLFSEEFPVDAQ